MKKPQGILYMKSGEIIERDAESIILISSTVASSEPGTEGTVFIDHDVLSTATFINMIGELLIMMEKVAGENAVAQACAHYAADTNKIHHIEGEVDIAYIRGRKNNAAR